MILEINPYLRGPGLSPEDIFDFLARHGYRGFQAYDLSTPITANEIVELINAVFLPARNKRLEEGRLADSAASNGMSVRIPVPFPR